MTNLEHLLENAICACERGETLEDYRNAPMNRMMLADTGADAEMIWEMAQYVVHTYCLDKTRWIPVTERLPEPDDLVLTYCPGRKETPSEVVMRGWAAMIHATHWMPLPSAPEVE